MPPAVILLATVLVAVSTPTAVAPAAGVPSAVVSAAGVPSAVVSAAVVSAARVPSARVPAAVASAAVASAGPVEAVPVDLSLGDTTLVGDRAVEIDPAWSAAERVPLPGAVLTFDLTGLAGVAVAEPGFDPTTTCVRRVPARLVCTSRLALEAGPVALRGVFPLSLVAAAGAVPGDTGRVGATLTARGVLPVTRTARVRVAEAVALTAAAGPPVEAAPGERFELSSTVRNAGTVPVAGVTVVVSDQWAFQPRSRFRNCRYADDRLLSCRFDQRLTPGTSYRLRTPWWLRRDSQAPVTFYSRQTWLTAAEAEDAGTARAGVAGDGGTLRLVAEPAARRVPQADPEPTDNVGWNEVLSTGRQLFDLAAVGDRAAGAPGDRVTLTVGVRNRGPATTDGIRAGENVATLDVILPPGLTVLRRPPACHRRIAGRYTCHADYFMLAGERENFLFGLRIDGGRAARNGSVTVSGMGHPDLNPGNDRASLVVTVPVPGGGPGGVGKAGAGGPGAGGVGGAGDAAAGGPPAGLPVNGPGRVCPSRASCLSSAAWPPFRGPVAGSGVADPHARGRAAIAARPSGRSGTAAERSTWNRAKQPIRDPAE